MNRAERRAIQFGRAFNVSRLMYNLPTPSGMEKEMKDAWWEYCGATEHAYRDVMWVGVYLESDQ